MAFASMDAQTNPQAGYIITLGNDTVYGTVDYRTDAKNARSCLFRADGEQTFREYMPQDISGYRLQGQGVFYVARSFPVEGETKTFFAEYLLKGGVSLYRHRENETDYYYFVDENGNVSTLKETGVLKERREDRLTAQREKVQEATHIFMKSPQLLQQLWSMTEVTPAKLTRLTRQYNDEFCKDAGESVTYVYDSNLPNKIDARLRLELGMGFDRVTAWPVRESDPSLKMNSISPIIGVGADVVIPRFSKNVVLQAMLLYSYNSMSTKPGKFEQNYSRELKFHDIALQAGVAYRFIPEKKITPIIRGGVSIDYLLGFSTKHMNGYTGNTEAFSQHTTVSGRYYGGAGVEYMMGTHRLSLTGNYVMRNFGTFGFRAPMFTVNIGYVM